MGSDRLRGFSVAVFFCFHRFPVGVRGLRRSHAERMAPHRGGGGLKQEGSCQGLVTMAEVAQRECTWRRAQNVCLGAHAFRVEEGSRPARESAAAAAVPGEEGCPGRRGYAGTESPLRTRPG